MAYLFLVRCMAVVATSAILLAATPTPVPVRVAMNDLVGMWVTVRGDCSKGQHLLDANGKYKVWCFDSISEGEWSLRGGNKIVVKHDPKQATRRSSQYYVSSGTLITRFLTFGTRMAPARNG